MDPLYIIAISVLTILAWLWSIKILFAWFLTRETWTSRPSRRAEVTIRPVPGPSYAQAARPAAALVAAK